MAARSSLRKHRGRLGRAGLAGRFRVESLESRLVPALTLTPAGSALGLTLTTFASGLANGGTNSVGPVGLGFGSNGSVLVEDDSNGTTYVFPTEADNQSPSAATSLPQAAIGMTLLNGKLYGTNSSDLILLKNDGTQDTSFTPIPVSGAFAIAANPVNGHLLIGGGSNIYDVDPVAGTSRLAVSGDGPDGVSVSPDGKTVYAADGGSTLDGFTIATGAKVFSTSISTVDGSAVGDGPFAGKVFGNTNDGRLVMVDIASGTQTVIASGGSRGDWASLDPHNGTFLLTQTDRVLRLSANTPAPTVGSLSPTSLTASSSAETITVNGSNFNPDAVVEFNGTTLATTVVSGTQLTAVVPASDLTRSGTDTLTVVNPGFGGGVSQSQTVTINPGPASQLVLSGLTPGVAGAVEHATVTAVDAFGNTATAYSGTVHFTSSDPNASLPADATLANGTGTFAVTLKAAGSDSVTAADTTSASIKGTQSGVAVTPAAAASLSVTGLAGGVAGSPETVTVTAVDAFGNVVPSYSGTVHFASSDPDASLPADATLTNGVGSFPIGLVKAGSDSVTVTDTVTASVGGLANAVVTPAVATHYNFNFVGPAGLKVGIPDAVTINALDAYGNLAVSYNGLAKLTSSDAHAVLPATVALSGGVGTFQVEFQTAGAQSLSATDTIYAGLSGTNPAIQVALTATKLVISGPAGPVMAGQPATYTVTALDANGNVATAYAGTVHFSSSDPNASLPADTTLTNGMGTYVITMNTAGSQSLTVADTVNAVVTGSEPAVAVGTTVKGTVYLDLHASGTQTADDPVLAGRVVFLDLKHDGTLDPGDPTATTDASGAFTLVSPTGATGPVLEDTGQDGNSRYVVDQSASAGGGVSVGVVPISLIAPVPVILDPFAAGQAADAKAAYVESLYRAVLDRDGSAPEVATWTSKMNAGMTQRQVAAGFVGSPEHRLDEVIAYYKVALNRAPDPYAAHWVNQLLSGESEEHVLEGILGSPEFLATHQDPATLVRDLYIDVLGRQGSSIEVAYYQGMVAAGASTQAIIANFVGSAESAGQIVQSDYVAFLHRTREAVTSDVWATMLESPNGSATDIAVDILSGPEYLQATKKNLA